MRTWGGRLLVAVVMLLAIVSVGLGGASGWMWWDRVETKAAQETSVELPPLATEQIPKMFGYDYQTVERSLTEAATLLTPSYRQEFQDRANKDIIPQARDRQLISQAHVVGVGVLDAHRDSGSVMVFMNRTVTDKSKEPVYDGSRLKIDYQRIDGRWLINYITPM
jgi:Mce-associated membrane protein